MKKAFVHIGFIVYCNLTAFIMLWGIIMPFCGDKYSAIEYIIEYFLCFIVCGTQNRVLNYFINQINNSIDKS